MDDLADLYQEIILAHNKRPHNEGILDPRTHDAEGYNPLCGDRLVIHARQDPAGKLEAVQFSGEGCAISRASASMMTDAVKGLSGDELRKKAQQILEYLTAREAPPALDLAEYGDLAALSGVRKFPARIKCATLAWHTLLAALAGKEQVSTEEA